jgi:hypothetical protein
MNGKLKVLLVSAVPILGMFPGAAEAQQPGTKAPVPHDHVLSANPFLLMWEWTNAEFERKVSPSGTVGVGGSWISLDGGDEDFKNLNFFYRHYPQGAAFSGFYIGGRAGVYHVSDDDDSGTAFGAGFDVGYAWLLGAERTFYIGMGLGATRLLGGDLPDGTTVTIPNLRLLNIGLAF